jgi:predicted nucleic acid-binding protein
VRRILVDTGPLVAILAPEERHHPICVSLLRSLPSPLITCWPVITEAMWLLRKSPRSVKKLLSAISAGVLEIPAVTAAEAGQIGSILDQYASLRPQFADAMVVYLARRENIETIFTLDRRDFLVYRNARNRPFHLIPS